MTDYNGWKNRQTWNVALWIQNDEPLYRAAVDYVKAHPTKRALYSGFCDYAGLTGDRTPDRIAWQSTRICYAELNAMMRELVS